MKKQCSIFRMGFLAFMATLSISAQTLQDVQFNWDFESGFAGTFSFDVNQNFWILNLAPDNGNEELPERYRRTFFFRASNVSGIHLQIMIEDVYWLCGNVPVASFDGSSWFRLDPAINGDSFIDVSVPENQDEIFISYTFPYTVSRKDDMLSQIAQSSFVEIDVLGLSEEHDSVPDWARTVDLITITNQESNVTSKKKIWIHARVHSGEIPPSYAVEGLVNWLVSDPSHETEWLRDNCIIHIVPMVNPSGVFLGNYRTNAQSHNLENQWCQAPEIDDISPFPEIQAIKEKLDLLNQDGEPVVLALNLHATQTQPREGHFHFKHITPSVSQEFESIQQYWIQRFDSYASQFNDINPATSQLNSCSFVESYLWNHYQESVMALTLELMYSNRDNDDGLATQEDFLELGAQMGRGLFYYLNHTQFHLRGQMSQPRELTLISERYPSQVAIEGEQPILSVELPAQGNRTIDLPVGHDLVTIDSNQKLHGFQAEGRMEQRLAIEKTPSKWVQEAVLAHIPSQDWEAILTVSNYGHLPSELSLTPDGDQGASTLLTVAPQDTVNLSVRDQGQEWLELSSDQAAWHFRVTYERADRVSSTMELLPQDQTRVFLPHLPADRVNFWFGFVLTNSKAEPISLSMSAYSDAGELVGTRSETLESGEKKTRLLEEAWPDLHPSASWIEIRSDKPLQGMMLFGTQNGQSLAGLPLSGNTHAHQLIPVLFEDSEMWHGIAVINPNSWGVDLDLVSFNRDGIRQNTTTEHLPPHSKRIWLLSQLDGFDAKNVGWVRMDSSSEVIGLELVGDTQFLSLEGFLLPELESPPRVVNIEKHRDSSMR